ncbi:MAG: hypothetical protein KDD43_15970, partial [Bdellovibrionales bacterium]|nr:hypothetical protein [Bdellovibrionales bacterium]
MKPFAFLWFFLGLSLVPPKAFGFRILVAQERKGELRGHLDKNPPIPIYGPDTIDLSYVDQGRLVTIRDRSGALTLAISVDATQHILLPTNSLEDIMKLLF